MRKHQMKFIFVEDVREVFEIALAPRVEQNDKETGNSEVTKPKESATEAAKESVSANN